MLRDSKGDAEPLSLAESELLGESVGDAAVVMLLDVVALEVVDAEASELGEPE